MKPRKPLRKVSKRKAERLRLYNALRIRFMLDHPFCQACKTINAYAGFPLKHTRFADDVHHTHGRLGELLFDQRYWLAVCRNCHRWIGEHPSIARSMGFLCPVGQWNKITPMNIERNHYYD